MSWFSSAHGEWVTAVFALWERGHEALPSLCWRRFHQETQASQDQDQAGFRTTGVVASGYQGCFVRRRAQTFFERHFAPLEETPDRHPADVY